MGSVGSVGAFRAFVEDLGADIQRDDGVVAAPDSPLAAPAELFGKRAGNRFAIHPMEGWDGTTDGRPTDNTIRRWRRFGESGAKLIWGGEAVAVPPPGPPNPTPPPFQHQTVPHPTRLP